MLPMELFWKSMVFLPPTSHEPRRPSAAQEQLAQAAITFK